jgi:Right handed beta helix region
MQTRLIIDAPDRCWRRGGNRAMASTFLTRLAPSFLLLTLAAAHAEADISTCSSLAPIPAPPSNAKIFNNASGNDDLAQIQAAINALHSGDWLVFQPGTYKISKHLNVAVNGVTLYGKDAVIHSTSPTDGGMMIEGDDVSIYNFTLNQDSNGRQGTPWAGGISIFDQHTSQVRRRIVGSTIRGNTINNAANVGIIIYKGMYYTIAENKIYRSWADGIHSTGGSAYGRVVHNQVSQNGDDMIAIVSYAGLRSPGAMSANSKVAMDVKYRDMSADELAHDIYVAYNQLSDTYWGRGVAVIGGSNVTIEHNDISRTPTTAGIYLLREVSYTTFGDHNILVRDNSISDVQTEPPTYKPSGKNLVLTHQGAIEISSQIPAEEFGVSRYKDALSNGDIAILNNSIRNSKFAGIRLGALSYSDNTTRNVVINGNHLENVGADGIASFYSGMDRASVACQQNTLNGSQTSKCDRSSSAESSSAAGSDVTGASLVCTTNGEIQRAKAPKAPTLDKIHSAVKGGVSSFVHS